MQFGIRKKNRNANLVGISENSSTRVFPECVLPLYLYLFRSFRVEDKHEVLASRQPDQLHDGPVFVEEPPLQIRRRHLGEVPWIRTRLGVLTLLSPGHS